MQPKIIPVPPADEQTRYSLSEDFKRRFESDTADRVYGFVEYVLWECSTEFMVTAGMPTNKDVSIWVEWLSHRPDGWSSKVQSTITMCLEYIGPKTGVAQGEC